MEQAASAMQAETALSLSLIINLALLQRLLGGLSLGKENGSAVSGQGAINKSLSPLERQMSQQSSRQVVAQTALGLELIFSLVTECDIEVGVALALLRQASLSLDAQAAAVAIQELDRGAAASLAASASAAASLAYHRLAGEYALALASAEGSLLAQSEKGTDQAGGAVGGGATPLAQQRAMLEQGQAQGSAQVTLSLSHLIATLAQAAQDVRLALQRGGALALIGQGETSAESALAMFLGTLCAAQTSLLAAIAESRSLGEEAQGKAESTGQATLSLSRLITLLTSAIEAASLVLPRSAAGAWTGQAEADAASALSLLLGALAAAQANAAGQTGEDRAAALAEQGHADATGQATLSVAQGLSVALQMAQYVSLLLERHGSAALAGQSSANAAVMTTLWQQAIEEAQANAFGRIEEGQGQRLATQAQLSAQAAAMLNRLQAILTDGEAAIGVEVLVVLSMALGSLWQAQAATAAQAGFQLEYAEAVLGQAVATASQAYGREQSLETMRQSVFSLALEATRAAGDQADGQASAAGREALGMGQALAGSGQAEASALAALYRNAAVILLSQANAGSSVSLERLHALAFLLHSVYDMDVVLALGRDQDEQALASAMAYLTTVAILDEEETASSLAGGQFQIERLATVSLSGRADAEAGVSEAYAFDDLWGAGSVITVDALLSLAHEMDMLLLAATEFGASFVLGRQQDLEPLAQAVAEARLVEERQEILDILVQALSSAEIEIAIVRDLVTAGIPFVYVATAGRTFVVPAESRQFVIAAEPRELVVGAEARVFVVDRES